MLKRWLSGLVICLVLSGTVLGADLYKVKVQNPQESELLKRCAVDPIVRLNDGFLVLADQASIVLLQESDLTADLIATDLSREELALDGRLDRINTTKFTLLFEQDNLRLYQIDPATAGSLAESDGLFPIGNRRPSMRFESIGREDKFLSKKLLDLDSLISLINRDSLQSYTERLQAFYRRTAGTSSNYASRDWIAAQFTSFGYDSVVIDSFQASLGGPIAECQNVLAYKIGTRLPDHHIVVGAHRDAVSSSPGANDNGSGTAAVIEIARALSDIETDLTIVFALFDAEEYGLYGSYHYVDEAIAGDDSIAYMLNMDMIGHYQNTSNANLFHGSLLGYSQLWQQLADSLVGLTGYLAGGSGGSDHYPFQQAGFEVTFVHEYIFSTVYHSYQDSTTYMNFDYMTKMVKASLATIQTVSNTFVPAPVILFEYPSVVPDMLTPDMPTVFEVIVSGAWNGVPVDGSGQLHYSIDGGSYVAVPMIEIAASHYEATIPGISCQSTVEYYVSCQDASGPIFYDPPPSQPEWRIAATGADVVFQDDFETDQGWTVSGFVTDGQWERGVPVGGGTRGDPPTDYDGSGNCYLTDNVAGNSDVDGGTTTLLSPVFDLSARNAHVEYARWFSNSFGSSPYIDKMLVRISNNSGASYVVVDSAGPVEQADGGWYEHSFLVSDFITPTASMRVRFDATDGGSGSVVEAAVDAFVIKDYFCEDPYVCADVDGDGSQPNIADLTYLVAYLFQSGPPPPVLDAANIDGIDEINVADLTYLVAFLFLEGPPPVCGPFDMK